MKDKIKSLLEKVKIDNRLLSESIEKLPHGTTARLGKQMVYNNTLYIITQLETILKDGK